MTSVRLFLLSLGFLMTEAGFPALDVRHEDATTPGAAYEDAEDPTTPGVVYDGSEDPTTPGVVYDGSEDPTTPGVVYDGAEDFEEPLLTENQINARANVTGLFEGDIVLNAEQERELAERKGVNGQYFKSMIWQKGKAIRWGMDPSITSKPSHVSAIRWGIYHWQTKVPCITWQEGPYDGTQPALRFYYGNGCHSPIGKQAGSTMWISIGSGCDKMGLVAHEIGHALGFYHEHNRHDRDNYISINWGNIRPGLEHAFQKKAQSYADPRGLPYDLGSLMHYHSHDFARNIRIPVITQKRKPDKEMGQRRGLSYYDILLGYKMYC